MRRHILLPLLALAAAGPAFADDARKPDRARETCIDSRRINGWTSEGDRTLIVTLGASQRYRLELNSSANVFSVGSLPQLAFIPRSDGSLCAGWGHVGVDGQRIPILSITRVQTQPTSVSAEPEK